MIGKIIGAFVGDKIARQTSGMNGASGAALGVIASTVLRRVSLPAMVAIGVGGYFAKKYLDRQEADKGREPEGKRPAPPVTKAA